MEGKTARPIMSLFGVSGGRGGGLDRFGNGRNFIAKNEANWWIHFPTAPSIVIMIHVWLLSRCFVSKYPFQQSKYYLYGLNYDFITSIWVQLYLHVTFGGIGSIKQRFISSLLHWKTALTVTTKKYKKRLVYVPKADRKAKCCPLSTDLFQIS